MNIANVINSLRGLLVQNRDYSTIIEVPYVDGIIIPIIGIPEDIRDTILESTGACSTVRVTMFIRKRQEFLAFHPVEGDGFPLCTLRI